MIYGLSGKLRQVGLNHIVIGVAGVNYKVYIPLNQEKIPKLGEDIEVFTYFHLKEGGADLFGFFAEEDLDLFEHLVSVSGVGPKSAMSILSVATSNKIKVAIASGEPELLQRSSGVGRKTAERIILDLRDKVSSVAGGDASRLAESDQDVYEALISLGYPRRQVQDVLRDLDSDITDVRARLKEALKKIKG